MKRNLTAFLAFLLLLLMLAACGDSTFTSPSSSLQKQSFAQSSASAASQEQVQKAFIAYYGRPADPGGLDYWARQLDAVGGNWSPIIESFGNSAEATALLAGLTNEQKIDKLYTQMFGRTADSGGRTYYATGLSNGTFTLASLAVNIVNGASGSDATTVANKLASAQLFTNSLDTDAKITAYNATTVTSVQTWLATVTAAAATQGSVDTLVAGIVPSAGWVQTNLNPGTGRTLYATDTELYASTYQGVYATSSDGMPWFSKGPANMDVHDIIKSNQFLLAATGSGIYRSADNGVSWQLVAGSPATVNGGGGRSPRLFARNSTYVFVIVWAQGIFRSGDDGASWQQTFVGQDAVGYQDYGAMATCICAVGERIVIGMGSLPARLYSTSNHGSSWTRTEFPGNDLLFLYYANNKLYAGGSMGVYLSNDYGTTWSTQYSNTIDANGRLQGVGMFRDMVAYNNKLVAAVDFKSIYISSDDGKSWSSFNDGLISDWSFSSLAIKSPYLWILRDSFGNAYRRPLTDI